MRNSGISPPLPPDPAPPPVSGFEIVAPPSASKATVLANLPVEAHQRFTLDIVPALWDTAIDYGLDPVGLVAQAAHETGWGTYPGNVRPEFYNTCGLKVRHQDLFPGITDGDHPLAHQMFPNWRCGGEAHAQHLRAYVNWPVDGLIVDPRYQFVIGRYTCVRWADLGGRWAPSTSYGTAIEAVMTRLRAS